MDSKKLSIQLSDKIEALVSAYRHLKDENSMLREELQEVKAQLLAREEALLGFEDQADIKVSDIEAIIEKLEVALNGTEDSNVYY